MSFGTAWGRGGGGGGEFPQNTKSKNPQLFSYETKGIHNEKNFLFLSNTLPINYLHAVATAK